MLRKINVRSDCVNVYNIRMIKHVINKTDHEQELSMSTEVFKTLTSLVIMHDV